MRCNAMFEMLESRRLMSAAVADQSIVSDTDGRSIYTFNGNTYALPYIRSDGALVIEGSAAADNITVEQVTGIDPVIANTVTENRPLMELLEKAPSRLQQYELYVIMAGNLNVDNWAEHVQSSLDQLNQTKQFLADVQADDNNPDLVARFTEDIASQQQHYDESKAALDLMQNGSLIHVHMDGVYDVWVDASIVTKQLRIDSGTGSDNVAVSTNVQSKAWINGGSGADKLTTGSKRTIVYGGGGGDRLFSRSKHGGTLDGGTGADRYFNRTGEVQILARKDGDQVIVNNMPIMVTETGVFGTVALTSSCYYMVDSAAGKVDLLASA